MNRAYIKTSVNNFGTGPGWGSALSKWEQWLLLVMLLRSHRKTFSSSLAFISSQGAGLEHLAISSTKPRAPDKSCFSHIQPPGGWRLCPSLSPGLASFRPQPDFDPSLPPRPLQDSRAAIWPPRGCRLSHLRVTVRTFSSLPLLGAFIWHQAAIQ